MYRTRKLQKQITDLQELLEVSERKADILTNLLKEAGAEYDQTLQKTQVSEANFRAIFEYAPEAIYIIDIDTHRILDCNPFFEKWLGYTLKNLRSMHLEDILARAGRFRCRHLVLLHASRRHRLREVEELIESRLKPAVECPVHHLMVDWG